MPLMLQLLLFVEDSDVDWDVLAHGGSKRMGNHATTAVNSDEDRDVESEDDTDIESDESSTSSHFGNHVREANNAMQGDDVGMLCDEVPDAEDLRAPTMQECSSDPASYAAGSSKDCNPCIVNSTSQHLNMKMKGKKAFWDMLQMYSIFKSIVTIKLYHFTSHTVCVPCRTTFGSFVSWCPSYYSS